MNRVILIGNLGEDAATRYTQGGQPVSNFSIATTKVWYDKSNAKQEKTEWHRCTAWGERWEKLVQYLTKGSKIAVEGEIQYRQWENKDGVKMTSAEINVQHIELLHSTKERDGQGGGPRGGGQQRGGGFGGGQKKNDYTPPPGMDDDIPF